MDLDSATATVTARIRALSGHIGRVAEIAGVGRATVTKILAGKAIPRVTTLAALDRACAQVEMEVGTALSEIGGNYGMGPPQGSPERPLVRRTLEGKGKVTARHVRLTKRPPT